ncbi:MAG: cytochrome c oxidase subunit II [Pseudazoarcus pumilus]|nr:cytochrome c oxidase subunit II [Pseudazoarcus pumilus]
MSLFGRLAASGLMLVAAHPAFAQAKYNLQEPVTPVAEQIYDLHTLMLVICLVIFILVFGVMFYSIFAHRKSKGAVAAHFHENTTVEVLWTIVPVFILVGMAWPATKTIIDMRDASAPDITIKATGYQWKWGYDYVVGEGEGVSFVSTLITPRSQIENRESKGENYLLEVDNPVVVPVGKKVRVLLTANDVIHAWWVPALGVKQDAIPGFIRDAWFRADKEGVYRGVCAELCGRDHAYMPIEVHVVSEQAYAEWVASKKPVEVASSDSSVVAEVVASAPEAAAATEAPTAAPAAAAQPAADGGQLYASNCAACHQPNGNGLPPAFPALAGSAVVTGEPAGLIEVLLKGRPGTAMASFGHLADADIAAIATHVRGSWGNGAGAVAADAVAAAR